MKKIIKWFEDRIKFYKEEQMRAQLNITESEEMLEEAIKGVYKPFIK